MGQTLQGTQIGHHAHVYFPNAEISLFRAIAHIAGCRNIHAATDATAVDGGDDGFAALLDGVDRGL